MSLDTLDVPRLLRELGVKARARGPEFWACCPRPAHKDSTPSWSIRWQPGHPTNGRHHCFGCDEDGGILDLVIDLVGLSGDRAALDWLHDHGLLGGDPAVTDVVVDVQARVPTYGILTAPLGLTDDLTPLASAYLARRGVGAGQAQRWGIRCGAGGRVAGRVWIPYLDAEARLRWWTARAIEPGVEPRYLCPRTEEGGDRALLFGENRWPARGRDVVLTEGEFDALAAERAGAEAIAALGGVGGASGDRLRRLDRFERVIVATDADPAGDKAAAEVARVLAGRCEVVRARPEDGLDLCAVEQYSGVGAVGAILWTLGK
jgi:DNA primase